MVLVSFRRSSMSIAGVGRSSAFTTKNDIERCIEVNINHFKMNQLPEKELPQIFEIFGDHFVNFTSSF